MPYPADFQPYAAGSPYAPVMSDERAALVDLTAAAEAAARDLWDVADQIGAAGDHLYDLAQRIDGDSPSHITVSDISTALDTVRAAIRGLRGAL